MAPNNKTKLDIRRNEESALRRFADLNAAWIADLHFLEESDKKMVSHPETYIQDGNSVFSVHIDGIVAGACALKKDAEGKWELTKMAVDPAFQGHGIGKALIHVVEGYAKDTLGLDYIYLLSNTGNAAAIRLYHREGWTVFHEGPHPVYARANIGMEKYL